MCIWLISVDPEPLFFSVIFVDISPIKKCLGILLLINIIAIE